MRINNDALTLLKINTKVRKHKNLLKQELQDFAEDIKLRVDIAIAKYEKSTRLQRLWYRFLLWLRRRAFEGIYFDFYPQEDWWSIGREGKTIIVEEAKNWLTGKSTPPQYFIDTSLFGSFLAYSNRLQNLDRDENYRRAKMLLKYCNGMETLTVPLSFVEWIDK